MANERERAFLPAVASMHGDRIYADLTIACYGRLYNLHKAIVCTQSGIIEDYIAQHGFVHPDNVHSAAIFECAISFLYRQDYTLQHLDPEAAYPSEYFLREHVWVWQAAHYFELPALLRLAEQKFTAVAQNFVAAGGTRDGLLIVADAIYRTPSMMRSPLRPAVVDAYIKHFGHLEALKAPSVDHTNERANFLRHVRAENEWRHNYVLPSQAV